MVGSVERVVWGNERGGWMLKGRKGRGGFRGEARFVFGGAVSHLDNLWLAELKNPCLGSHALRPAGKYGSELQAS